jgi:hypothetical protein
MYFASVLVVAVPDSHRPFFLRPIPRISTYRAASYRHSQQVHQLGNKTYLWTK